MEEKKKRVIVTGPVWYGEWAKNLYHAFQRLGVDVIIVYTNFLPAAAGGHNMKATLWFERAKGRIRKFKKMFKFLKGARERLADMEILARVGHPDPTKEEVVLVTTFNPASEWLLKQLKKRAGVKLILWLGETVIRGADWPERIAYYDEFYLCDDGIYYDELTPELRARVKLLPFAGDDTQFHPLPEVPEKYNADVVFVGKYYDYKAKTLGLLKNYNLKIYGYGWDQGFEEFPWLKEKYFGQCATEELNPIYNGTKIAIGTMGTPASPYTTTTMRTYDIGLSGTFQVCETSHLARKLFGDTLGLFKDDGEIKPIIDHYLANEKEREEKAARAREIALQYTYTKAAEKFLAV